MTDDRTRQGRSEELATDRRRRNNATLGISKKLHIPEEVAARLKAEGREPRWANDDGNRIHNLTVADDWDKVEGVKPVPVGTAKDGTPIKAILLSKPASFLAEDRRELESKRKDMERAMTKGHVPTAPGAEEAAPVRGKLGAQTYVDSATSIGRGNQIIE